jgi:NAD(P)-dependent dehydrogenase (short-subunit alcohol dehydrogenase family)
VSGGRADVPLAVHDRKETGVSSFDGDSDDRPLAGRAGLVTGAASGIGRAAAMALVRAGARVMIGDIDEAGAQETLELLGGESVAAFTRTDITEPRDAEALVAATVKAFGKLDFAHNNAGIELTESPEVADVVPEDWLRLIQTNLNGAWNCLRAELPVMVAAGGGAIVNTASGLGLVAIQGHSPYIAAKHGLVGLTRAAAIEYGGRGIRVNCVCPGAVNTPLWTVVADTAPVVFESVRQHNPMKRFAEPEEIANAVVWLCSDLSSYVNGHPLVIDGGQIAGQLFGDISL